MQANIDDGLVIHTTLFYVLGQQSLGEDVFVNHHKIGPKTNSS